MAALLAATVLLAPNSGEAQTPALRADQKKLIEISIAHVEPAQREFAYAQMAKTVAPFNEAMIAQMTQAAQANTAKHKAATKVVAREEPAKEMTPEDRAFNKAQFEPVIRKHHAAQKAFDAFANARLKAYCPGRDDYARFGSGWRYEQGEFIQPSALATWNVDSNVEIASQAYAPQDGRYSFDFSRVRLTFDEAAVDAAIKSACDQVKARGKEFLAKVDPLIAAKDWDGAFKAEGAAQGKLEPIRQELQAKFAKISPGDFTEIQLAMMNGRRVKS